MNLSNEHITRLWELYLTNKANSAEVKELFKLAGPGNDNDEHTEILQRLLSDTREEKKLDDQLKEEMIKIGLANKNLLSENKPVLSIPNPRSGHRVHFLKTAWFRYAAILLLIAGSSSYLYYRISSSTPINDQVSKTPETPKPQNISPGGNRAILTLSDGSTIVLDSSANGELTSQGNTRILKLDAGSIAYNASGPVGGEVLYNTIRTPKGGQYQVVLSDGTRVWLNAASSITFPTVFATERQVTMSGEAYVEVARNKSKAFTLTANGTTIKVLGTSFNVNSYPDEPATLTTLVEGEVKIIKESHSIVLHPGEQAVVTDAIALNKKIQLNQVLAWKNGLFNFQNKKLEEVMRQLARWYDLEIVYPSSVPDITFVGGISRNMQLNDMLKTLEQSEVNYRMEGRKLLIMP